MIQTNQNRWQHHLIKTQPDIMSKEMLSYNIQQFFSHLALQDKHLLLLVKVMFTNGRIATLSKLLKTDNAEYTYRECVNNFNLKLDSYKFELTLKAFVFTYKTQEGSLNEEESVRLDIEPVYQIHTSNKFKLPVTLDPLAYGKIKMNVGTHYLVRIDKNLDAKIVVDGDINRVTILRDGEPVLNYTDKKVSNNSFKRTIGRNVYLYEDNLLTLYTKKQPQGFIKQLHPAKNINEKFIAMDIETYNHGGVLKPYCVGVYGENLCKSFYLSDYKNQEELLKDSVNSLLSEEYNGYKIYIHNLSNFDGIFLMKILFGLGKVSPIINEGRIVSIDLEVALENKNIKITFRDSYQILTSSLESLAKSFNLENKGLFPYDYVTPDNLDYVGSVPSISFFKEISIDEYEKYCDKFNGIWSLRDETIKYCLLDCEILYKVLLESNILE